MKESKKEKQMNLPTRPKPKKKNRERGCESMGSPRTTVA